MFQHIGVTRFNFLNMRYNIQRQDVVKREFHLVDGAILQRKHIVEEHLKIA